MVVNKDFVHVGVKITSAEILEKLEILRLERGISTNSFIIQAITEKLRREGYLKGGAKAHQKKEKELSDTEQLRRSLQKIAMRKP